MYPVRRGAAPAPLAAIDVGDAPMPEFVEMLDREACTVGVVGGHRCRCPTVANARPTDTSATSAATASSRATGMRQPATITPSTRDARNVSSGARFESRAASAAGEDELIAVSFGRGVDAVGDLGEPRVVQVVEQHADRHGLARREVPRHQVGSVAELRLRPR